jgi:lysophospholipase L1-like esterase
MDILLFGDSFLGRFNRNLIDQLESSIPNSTIYNGAVGGWNSADGAKRSQYMARLNPDYVLFSFGGNDTAPWKDQLSEQDFLKNMQNIFNDFTNSKRIMLLCPNVNVEDADQTEEFNRLLSKYNAGLIKICEQMGIQVIDTNNLFIALDDYHIEDGVHINQAGYDLIIKKFAESVK